MDKVFSLPFSYRSVDYYLLVQIKKSDNVKQFHAVTITENLTSKLYGSFVFEQTESRLAIKSMPDDAERTLVEKMILTIEQYLLQKITINK
jgi:hypothetical protein